MYDNYPSEGSNGEGEIYVSAPVEILSSKPIYDENPDDLGKQSFESIQLFSTEPVDDNYEDNKRKVAELLDQSTMCSFDSQFPKDSRLISVILELEFTRDHEQSVEHNLNSEVHSIKQRLYLFTSTRNTTCISGSCC